MPENLDNIIELSYSYLKLERYQDAFDLLHKYLNAGRKHIIPITVNYELARKGLNKKVRLDKVDKLRDSKKINSDQAALACLLNEHNEALDILEHCVNHDYEEVFKFKDWLVFDELVQLSRYKNY